MYDGVSIERSVYVHARPSIWVYMLFYTLHSLCLNVCVRVCVLHPFDRLQCLSDSLKLTWWVRFAWKDWHLDDADIKGF